MFVSSQYDIGQNKYFGNDYTEQEQKLLTEANLVKKVADGKADLFWEPVSKSALVLASCDFMGYKFGDIVFYLDNSPNFYSADYTVARRFKIIDAFS